MKIILIEIMIAALGMTAAAQDSMSVNEAVARVLRTHPSIDQARASILAGEARTSQAASAKLPDVSTDAIYTHIGPIPDFSFPLFGSIVLAPADNYDAHVSGRYTVYDFGKANSAVDLNRSKVETMRDAMELTKTNLSLQTIRVFYTIVFLRRSLLVQDEQLQALNEHLTVTQKRVEAGTATNFDVLTTEVRVATAQNQKVEIENTLEKQEAMLRQLLSMSTESLPPLKGAFDSDSVSLATDSLYVKALHQRQEMRVARDDEETAQRQKKLTSLGNVPKLNVMLAYGLKNGYEPDLYPVRGNWAWGAEAQIPIFDGDRVSHQVEEAQATIEANEAHTREVAQQIRSEVEQVVSDVTAAAEKVRISEVQLRQADEAVTIARTQYRTGSITNLDLLDAETAESTAKLAHLQALYRYTISRYELDRAVGDPLVGR